MDLAYADEVETIGGVEEVDVFYLLFAIPIACFIALIYALCVHSGRISRSEEIIHAAWLEENKK